MKINVDTRKHDCTYYDKELNHVARNNNIIKLINKDGSCAFNLVIDILAISLELNEQERNVLYLLNYYNHTTNNNELLKLYKDNYNRSRTTFSRAIDTLERKRVITVDGRGAIALREPFRMNLNQTGESRFLIIELYPNETSKNITL